MIRFLDGPAAGVTLHLRRAPWFLRVVKSRSGTWDALDQLTDEPEKTEAITVYRKVQDYGQVHVKASGRGGKALTGWYAMATYIQHETQPEDAVARSRMAWRSWAEDEAQKITEAIKKRGSVAAEKLPGPTGEFPEGKVAPDDEGEIKIAIATDKKNRVIRLEFGKPVAWLGLPKDAAMSLGNALQQKASELP